MHRWRSNKYQFYSLWFDPIRARTHNLSHSRRACKPLHHRCGILSNGILGGANNMLATVRKSMILVFYSNYPISNKWFKKKFIKISDNEDLFWFFILFSICYDVLRKLSILCSVVLVRLTLIYKSSLPLTWFLGKLGVGEDGLYKHTRFWWFKTYTDVHLYHVLMVTLQVIDGIAVQCHLKCVLKVDLAWKITVFFYLQLR